jgi:Cu/Ag efflux protein CusF
MNNITQPKIIKNTLKFCYTPTPELSKNTLKFATERKSASNTVKNIKMGAKNIFLYKNYITNLNWSLSISPKFATERKSASNTVKNIKTGAKRFSYTKTTLLY